MLRSAHSKSTRAVISSSENLLSPNAMDCRIPLAISGLSRCQFTILFAVAWQLRDVWTQKTLKSPAANSVRFSSPFTRSCIPLGMPSFAAPWFPSERQRTQKHLSLIFGLCERWGEKGQPAQGTISHAQMKRMHNLSIFQGPRFFILEGQRHIYIFQRWHLFGDISWTLLLMNEPGYPVSISSSRFQGTAYTGFSTPDQLVCHSYRLKKHIWTKVSA